MGRHALAVEALSDRVNGVGKKETVLSSMFYEMLAARRTDTRHVRFTLEQWDALEREAPVLGREALKRAARKHVVVIEVGGKVLSGFRGTQEQIDYLNKIITE